MARKKRILHIIQSLDNGGCENMLLRTLPQLSEFEHVIITLKKSGDLAEKFRVSGIPITNALCASPFDFTSILRLRQLVSEMKPDGIITYLFHADFLGRFILRGITQAPIVPFLRTTYNHPRYWIARLFECLTKPLVGHYLANSEAVKDFYVQHIGVASERITVIPNGIDTVYFDQLAPDPELRVSLSLSQDDFVIICVANLHPNKGHRFLLEAFESLWLEFPKTKLLLVGDGEERENIEVMIQSFQSKNAIQMLGRRNDVPALLRLSNLFVLPTLFEGQSNAILEAMAASVPVITTDIPENRCIIKDSITGLLVPKNDSTAIAEALRKLLSDTTFRKSLTNNAHDTIRNHHSLSSIRESWTTFLRAL